MSEWTDILDQIEKERIKKTRSPWVYAKLVTFEGDFTDPDTSDVSPSSRMNTIRGQVRTKPRTQKKKKERIIEKFNQIRLRRTSE